MTEGEFDNLERVPQSPPLRLKAATFKGWPVPQALAHTTLSLQRTVLVGRNGAGKSILIDGLYAAAKAAVGASPRTYINFHDAPPSVLLEFSVKDRTETLALEIEWTRSEDQPPSPDNFYKPLTRTERCWFKETGETLWSVVRETATLSNGTPIPVPPSLGLLSFNSRALPGGQAYAKELRSFLRGMRRINPGLPRPGRKEPEIVRRISIRKSAGPGTPSQGSSRVSRLAWQLVNAFERNEELFEEFSELARQLGLAKDVSVRTILVDTGSFVEPSKGNRESLLESDRLSMLSFDSVNIGTLSDGTLRVAEILWALVSLRSNDTLLLEEPETGIHPGLLRKLLAVLESYTTNRQCVISTHSIQVVNWANADEIRLVSRDETGATTSQALRAEQMNRVMRYLQDEGSLADFLYSGGVDE